MPFAVPRRVSENAWKTTEGSDWLRRLPRVVEELSTKWELSLGQPFDSDDVSAAWVAPATRRNGDAVVLKVGMPHMEGEQEIDGLRFWAGDPVVRLLESDDVTGAVVLERCVPGTSLRLSHHDEQDRVIADLLRRMWRRPSGPTGFRPLSFMVAAWSAESRARSEEWPDRRLVEAGLELMHDLAQRTSADVLLGTDIHAGNVLAAERQPWLVIDPKPFVGDPAYDATQHLLNHAERVIANPGRVIEGFASMLNIDAARVHGWLFARAAAEPRDQWSEASLRLARAVQP
jgi:streptomycin 6-kinase